MLRLARAAAAFSSVSGYWQDVSNSRTAPPVLSPRDRYVEARGELLAATTTARMYSYIVTVIKMCACLINRRKWFSFLFFVNWLYKML
uniref:Uncharacterized protein n=1 Tax=Anguilla anguilla TaxID=7936 RepID=A0A0E9PGV3_ANGAN